MNQNNQNYFQIIIILIICVSPYLLSGQKDTETINDQNSAHIHEGGEVHNHSHGPCISDNERKIVNSRIEQNIRDKNIILEKSSMMVLYDWPIEQNSSYNYNSTYALWQYVDHDPANPNQLEDYNCGDNTYDVPGYNHQGIDIGLWPFMQHQVNDNQTHVIAAAAGTIIDKNDGEPHLNCNNPNVDANYVILQHSDGSRSWYWHMKNGSVTTKNVGASVVVGEYLGVVASSGNSSGPHLHFECYDASLTLIDPYAGPCNNMNTNSFWNNQKPYWEPTINVLLTHDAPPDQSVACPGLEIKNEEQNFNAGDLVYFATYLHDQQTINPIDYKIRRPDNSIWQSWTHTTTSDHRVSWWYWSYTLPSNAQSGTWKWEGTLNGQTVSHDFFVTGPVEPNLTCSNSGSLSINNSLNVSGVQVINDGNATSGSSTLGYYLSSNTTITTSDYLAGTDFVSSLAINQTSTESTTINSSNIMNMPPDGSYYLGMIVDYLDVVSESDETDNNDCFFTSPQVIVGCTNSSAHNYNTSANFDNNACLTCSDGLQNGDETGTDCGGNLCSPCAVDLLASNCGTMTITGNTISLTGITITNQGTGSSNASNLGYYLSSDTNITASDYLIGTDFVTSLVPGQNSNESIVVNVSNISPPIPAGTYYVGLFVDHTNLVGESNEANNNDCFFTTFTVTYDCKNPSAHNYNPAATYDNNSCETCTDGLQNGDETDIDCGGNLCSACQNCSNTINVFPSISEFQGNIGNFTQSTTDNLDWTIISGPTSSGGTGSSATYSMDDYLYIEASGSPNAVAILNSTCYDLSSLTNPELSFAYNMEGAGMGSLSVLISDDDGSSWTVKFNKSGNQGVGWHKEVIDLSEFIGETIQISIEGTTGATYQSDIGIDQFIIKENCISTCTNTINTFNYNNFFENSIGDFEQLTGCDDIDWTHNTGPTPSSNTGPASGYLNSAGYMYTESSSPNNPFKIAIIESPCYNTSTLNLPAIYMTYHMYGTDMGFLEMEISDDNGQSWEQLLVRNGEVSNFWSGYYNENLNTYNNIVKFRITAITGNGFTSDMAFDYFWIYERCYDNYVFTQDHTVSNIYEANQSIISSSLITAPYIEYDAGQFIEMIPGFEVQSGTEFKAFIDGCGDNGNELLVPEESGTTSLKNKDLPDMNKH